MEMPQHFQVFEIFGWKCMLLELYILTRHGCPYIFDVGNISLLSLNS